MWSRRLLATWWASFHHHLHGKVLPAFQGALGQRSLWDSWGPSQPLLCVKCGAGFRGLGACDQRKGHSTLCRETQGQTVWASGLSPFLVFGGIGGCLGDSQRACADCSRRRDTEMLRGFFAPKSTPNACCLWLLEVPSQAWCCSRVCWPGKAVVCQSYKWKAFGFIPGGDAAS